MDTPANIILFFSCLLDPGKRGLALPNGAPSWYTSPPASFGLTSPFLSSHQPLCSAHMLLMKSSSRFLTLRRPWCSSPLLPLSFVTTSSTIQVYLASLPTMSPLNAPILPSALSLQLKFPPVSRIPPPSILTNQLNGEPTSSPILLMLIASSLYSALPTMVSSLN